MDFAGVCYIALQSIGNTYWQRRDLESCAALYDLKRSFNRQEHAFSHIKSLYELLSVKLHSSVKMTFNTIPQRPVVV